MARPTILDMFCGGGGAGMGYYRAGFDVVGIDIKTQPHYPCYHDAEYASHFKFYQADALEFPLEGYDAYHASPPCQAYTDNPSKKKDYPKLIEPIRERLLALGKPFVIENVYKAPLEATLMLCGTMFGLRVIRHRYFEFNWSGPMAHTFSCCHQGSVAKGNYIACYTGGHHAPTLPDGTRPFRKDANLETMLNAMGINWMATKFEVKEAIPPAYTEYIGKYLLEAVLNGTER